MKSKSIFVILLVAVLSSFLFACDIRNEVTGEDSFSCTIIVDKDEAIELNCAVVSGNESANVYKAEAPLWLSLNIEGILNNLAAESDFTYEIVENEFGSRIITEICGVSVDSSSMKKFAFYLNNAREYGDILSYEIEDESAVIQFVLVNY